MNSSLSNNNDFLAKSTETATASSSEPTEKNKRRTALEIEMDNFPEYHALSPYHRKCLIATNYWRVMNGEKITEVPESDIRYHKYFDKNCYELAKGYQIKKNLEKEYNENYKNMTHEK
jgi:hypothetical protein